MKVILEPRTIDQWKTEADVDEYHRQNTEVYDFTDEEYNEFVEEINGHQASNKRDVEYSGNDNRNEKKGI